MPAYDSSRFNPPAPLAWVSLKDIGNGLVVSDIPMLIDSGADVTLIPLSFANQLNLSDDSSRAFELEGFDGNKSTARVVRAELHFLNRTFKGEFLVVDQDYGYLGRNILNHVSLVLDGPCSTWDEQK